MKGSKSSRVDLLEKKIEALIRVVQQILDENNYLKDLAVGTLETVKNIDGYEQAIEKLKEKMVAESGKTKETDTNRKIIE
jgi:hypothetical protein